MGPPLRQLTPTGSSMDCCSPAAASDVAAPAPAFIVTGFGRFFDAHDNPTQHLVAWLTATAATEAAAARRPPQLSSPPAAHPAHHPTSSTAPGTASALPDTAPAAPSLTPHAEPEPEPEQPSAPAAAPPPGPPSTSASALPLVLSTTVLRVAAEDVRAWMGPGGGLDDAVRQAADRGPAHAGQPLVLLHLGVDAQGRGFKLESAAYNNAHFRNADEAGWRPQSTPISPDLPLEHCASCALPLARVKEELASQGFEVEVSNDPGRFLCNYVYWCSLQHSSQHRQHYSLFIHVPPFEVVGEQEQRSFLLAAIKAVANAATFAAQSKA